MLAKGSLANFAWSASASGGVSGRNAPKRTVVIPGSPTTGILRSVQHTCTYNKDRECFLNRLDGKTATQFYRRRGKHYVRNIEFLTDD